MKRGREIVETQIFDIAKFLINLSHQGIETRPNVNNLGNNDFECKTCNRRFSSFQALGGHRASHKRPKSAAEIGGGVKFEVSKPKIHGCGICGKEFPMGQALGGHMRRHRAAMKGGGLGDLVPVVSSGVPVLKRMNSSKRVVCMDLNLTPLENDLEILFGKNAPKVDLFL